jgi:prepilin-type processing-associated H-X9-DG protein
MKRSLPLGVAFLLLLIAANARAQPLSDRLPGSTMVYVGWSPSAALQTTAAARMLADERVMGPWRRVFNDVLAALPQVEGGEKISVHVPALLAEAAQCEGCFALLELKPDKQGRGGRLSPQSVLMIDLGARRKKFEEHFKPLHAALRERYGENLKMMKLERSWVWFRADHDGRPRMTWGFVGDVFVMFFGESSEDFIPRLVKGQFENSLRASPAFADSLSKIPAGGGAGGGGGGGEPVLTTYLDVKSSLALLKQVVQREGGHDLQLFVANWDKVLDELGVANVRGIAEKTTVEDRQFVTRSLIRTDGAPKGLLALLAAHQVDDAMVKAIPADAMVAAAWRLDLAKFYEQIKASAIRIAGKDATDGFNQLEQGAEGLGLPLKDVLGSLGDQWAVYNAQSQGGLIFTGWTLVGTIRDPEKFRRSAEVIGNALAKAVGDGDAAGHVRQIDADGVKVSYVQLGRWSAPFAPSWAAVDDRLIIALYPQHVEDAIAHLKNGGKSLLDNPDFQSAMKRTGSSGPVVYMSGPRVAENVYPVGLLIVSLINSFGGWGGGGGDDGAAEAGADLLPSYQRLLQYVGHDAASVKSTPDGLLKTRTVANPLLSPLAWFDSPVIAMAVLIPTMSGFEDTADRTKSANNLRQIGQGLLLYANENKGAYPANLQEVIRTQDVSPDVLKSPAGPAKNGPDVVYLYFKGMNTTIGAEVPVAYDAALLEQGEGTNVLFGDGHVDWVEAGAIAKVLEAAKKREVKPEP